LSCPEQGLFKWDSRKTKGYIEHDGHRYDRIYQLW